ncbi:MAG: hypothetical protein Q8M94_14590, partial [Ignavibacteria bacterium]|nr:hypothetical protein [Ignavibacteria bacterium]
MNPTDHISRLNSWLAWRNYLEKNPGEFGSYVFPQSIQLFERATGAVCPVCHGNGTGPVRG